MRQTVRTGKDEHNFQETTTGDAPSSVEASIDMPLRTGQKLRLTVKLYYGSTDSLRAHVQDDMAQALHEAYRGAAQVATDVEWALKAIERLHEQQPDVPPPVGFMQDTHPNRNG